MLVLKFGGSSVADATRISAMMDIVSAAIARDRVILVCSAISGCTDSLIEIDRCEDPLVRKNLAETLLERHYRITDRLFTGEERKIVKEETTSLFEEMLQYPNGCREAFGEMFSTRIIERKFFFEGVSSHWLDSRNLICCSLEGDVKKEKSYRLILSEIENFPDVRLFVAPGFIASDENGKVVTLGRGGSDYSAALYAAGVKASFLEIWTDVSGMMTSNPKQVPSAYTIPDMSYESAFALAENGAKVLYSPTVIPAKESGIAINIRNSFSSSNPGTVISNRPSSRVENWIGVTSLDKGDLSRICLVGESVLNRKTADRRLLSSLDDVGIKPVGDVTGEGNILFVDVRRTVVKEALLAVHREFFEDRTPTIIDVFLAGYGAVGKALVEIISTRRKRIEEATGRSIRIVGVSDSRHYFIDMRGIETGGIERRLSGGLDAKNEAYISAVIAVAPRKAVFVDCTDDNTLYTSYEKILTSGLNIVTSNRRSLAVPYVKYAAIKAAARENGVFFRYDTTVGASLPILESISGSANCSDGIVGIEAVVSCTLNYLMTGYGGNCGLSMAQMLRKAQDTGLTERDPRQDLGGRDVLRKLLIMAREAGIPLEESDVQVTPVLGKEFFDCDIDEFYRLLSVREETFAAQERELSSLGLRERFVASVVKDPSSRLGFRAEIKMKTVDADSPFFRINGTENVTIIKSEYSAPLVIKGAGEGVNLAATGIIKDILMR